MTSFSILTYSFGYDAGRSNIESAFENAGLKLDITLPAADTDVIKTYVRLGMCVGLIAATAHGFLINQDLVTRDLSHLIR